MKNQYKLHRIYYLCNYNPNISKKCSMNSLTFIICYYLQHEILAESTNIMYISIFINKELVFALSTHSSHLQDIPEMIYFGSLFQIKS